MRGCCRGSETIANTTAGGASIVVLSETSLSLMAPR